MAEWNASDNLTDHQTTRNAQRWWPESQIQKEKWKMLALLVKVRNRLWRTAESVEIHCSLGESGCCIVDTFSSQSLDLKPECSASLLRSPTSHSLDRKEDGG